MKWICRTIWILGVLLIVAALDARPDPPAVNPNPALCQVSQLHACSCEIAARRYDFPITSYPVAVSFVAADGFEPSRPSDRMVLTGQPADPSPHVKQDQHKLSFKS